MIRQVLGSAGTVIEGLSVLYCRPAPDANVITTRTLGGSWHVQTVGDPASVASVQVRAVGLNALTALQNAYAEGASITVQFDGYNHVGYLPNKPDWDVIRRGPADTRVYRVTFTLNIDSREAIT